MRRHAAHVGAGSPAIFAFDLLESQKIAGKPAPTTAKVSAAASKAATGCFKGCNSYFKGCSSCFATLR
jgi:hypothetical protein